jgi:hypothetical protein
MRLPFTVEQFLDVFARYNEAVWPMQWVLLGLGMFAVILALAGTRTASRAVSGILAFLWLWMGAVYHLTFFQEINPAAAAFGVLFIAQGVLFLWVGAWKGRLTIARPEGARFVMGVAIMVYALVAYPLLGYFLGHRFPATPTFGAPCPTTILTLGLLAWATSAPRITLMVPVVWALVGTSAALQLGMVEDFGLLPAAIVAISVTVGRRREQKRAGGTLVGQVKEAT